MGGREGGEGGLLFMKSLNAVTSKVIKSCLKWQVVRTSLLQALIKYYFEKNMDTYKIVNGGMVDEKAFHHECTVNEITKFIHLPARNTFEPLDKFKYNLNTSKRDLSLLEKLASLLTLEALSVDHVQVAQLFHHHILHKLIFSPAGPWLYQVLPWSGDIVQEFSSGGLKSSHRVTSATSTGQK